MLSGRSGIRTLTQEWAAELPVRFAASAAVDPSEVLDRVEARKLDRTQQFALIAAREAWADAGSPDVDPERLGVGHRHRHRRGADPARPVGHPAGERPAPGLPAHRPDAHAQRSGRDRRARARRAAGVHTPVSACASGAEAVAYATEMIRTGRADVVVAGGTEACIHPLPLAAFARDDGAVQAQRRAERASRPYDKGRDGFVFGEGAAVLVLESEEHAAGPRRADLRRGRPASGSPPTATTSRSRTRRAAARSGRCGRPWTTRAPPPATSCT